MVRRWYGFRVLTYDEVFSLFCPIRQPDLHHLWTVRLAGCTCHVWLAIGPEEYCYVGHKNSDRFTVVNPQKPLCPHKLPLTYDMPKSPNVPCVIVTVSKAFPKYNCTLL